MDKCEMLLIKSKDIEMTDVTLVNEDDKQNLAHTSKKICSYYNKGYCKFKNNCSKIHSLHICSKFNCRNKACCDRHPNNCRYKEKCRQIKECLYMHNQINLIDDKLNDKEVEIKKLVDQTTELTIQINKLKEENLEKSNELFNLNKDNENNSTVIKRLTEEIDNLVKEIKSIKSAKALETKMLNLKIEELEDKNEYLEVIITNIKKEKNTTVDKCNKLAEKHGELTKENMDLNINLDERIEKHNNVIKEKHKITMEIRNWINNSKT